MYSTARTTPRSREFLVAESRRIGPSRVANNMGISRRTVHSPRRTPDAREAAVLGLRMELRWGPDRLGPYLGMPASTAYAVLRRHGAHQLRRLFPPERVVHGRFSVTEPGYIAIDIARRVEAS